MKKIELRMMNEDKRGDSIIVGHIELDFVPQSGTYLNLDDDFYKVSDVEILIKGARTEYILWVVVA